MKTKLLTAKDNKIIVKDDTQYVLIPTKDSSVDLIMNTRGTSTELLVLMSLHGSKEVKLLTNSLHNAPHTTCRVSVKGVLFDKSKADYVGKIIINKKAQQTNSYLEDDVLLVGHKTKNYSQPILEIEADDVKASHGATTGRINEDQIYYLRSRGLARDEAENIIIEGFFEDLISKIHDERIKEKVRKKINA